MSINWPPSDLREIHAGRSHFKAAIVCRRGHVLSSLNSPNDLIDQTAPKCSTCGADNLKACPNCGNRIKGGYYSPMLISFTEYQAENFCEVCGRAFPWASQQARIWELENALDEQSLDEADRQQISFQLEKIATGKLGEEDELKAWHKIKSSMGSAVNNERVKSLIFDLVGSYIKTKVFL